MKLNEASTLSALGLSKKDIAELHDLVSNLPHDMEYVPLDSKSQAIAYAKSKDRPHLIIGINDEGKSIGILQYYSYSNNYYEVVVDGKHHRVGSLKNALAFLPGKLKWYRSATKVTGERGSKHAEEEYEKSEFIYNIVERIERIYGKKLKTEARKYMKEIRNAIGSAVTQDKRQKVSTFDKTAADSLASLKSAYDKLEEIATSKTPFEALANASKDRWDSNREGFAGLIADEVGDYRYDRYEPSKAGSWAKENPAAIARIVRFALSKLRSIRDGAFDNYHKEKAPIETEPYRLRVREAYERFRESGEVRSITKED